MKRCAFYGRYSSVLQNEQSIEGQLHVAEKFAEQNGMEIVYKYIDRAVSGTSDKRPEFQKMIEDSKKGKFEYVLVYKLDRFARNRYDSAIYKKKLRDNGVKVISATENITDTPEGIIMEGLLEAMDEYYSAELGRKMRRGKEESFRKGKYIGAFAPFGYKIVNRRLEIDELTAPIIKEIFQRFADGERQASILKDLNNKGIKNSNGRNWNKANISYMLKNEIYKGVYKVSDYEGEMSCPAIVSDDVFEQVQKQKEISINKARKSKTDFDYMLTGKMICAKCGAHVCGVSIHRKYNYYQCHKKCGHHIPADILHEEVYKKIREYLTPEKAEEIAQAAYSEYTKEEAPANEQELLKSELLKVEKQIENGIKAVLSGLDSQTLKDTIKECENRRDTLRAELETISVAIPKLKKEYFKFAFDDMVKKAETEDMKKLLNTIVSQIIVDDMNIVICINLTDNTNVPPLEQIMFKVKDNSLHLTQNKIIIIDNCLLIAAVIMNRRQLKKSGHKK